MERPQIIKKFLDHGRQLSGDALELLSNNQERIDELLEKMRNWTAPPTITSDFLTKMLKREGKEKSKRTPEDYTIFFSKRFEAIRTIFSKRPDLVNLVSINKVSERAKKFSIIGTVKEKDPETNTITLEDNTGETSVKLKGKTGLGEVVEDEVLGALCEKTDLGIISENIFFPDVPMKREINKTKEDVYCLFVSDFHMDSNSFKEEYYSKFIEWLKSHEEKINIFVLGDLSSDKNDIKKLLSSIPKTHHIQILRGEIDPASGTLPNPSCIEIENVKILLLHNPRLNYYTELWGSPSKAISILVRKRHLDPTFTPQTKIYDKDPYLLETIPDIIAAGHTHIPSNTNYKGITILTTGSFISQPIFWLINLRTREIFKTDFS